MADERGRPPNLKDQPVDQRRNADRGGDGSPLGDSSPLGDGSAVEANATMRRVWSEPGGEANNFRNAMVGAGTKADDHGELTAAETPETTRHLSDATLSPDDKDATAEAIERATAVQGDDEGRG